MESKKGVGEKREDRDPKTKCLGMLYMLYFKDSSNAIT